VRDGQPVCLPDEQGRDILPSAVRFEGDEEVVGWDALAGAIEHAATTITSVKRFMGRSLAEAQAEADQLPYEVAEGDDKVVRIQVGDETVTPIEVSAHILKTLFWRAEDVLGGIGGAVITVPAYFDDAQRQATRDAARLCGLEVLRLLNEPTAAAIAYGLQEAAEGVYAVYDLGGGTFDISILELTDGVFQVLSTAGDTHLGGDDLDRRLAGLLLRSAGMEGAGGGVLRAALMAAEQLKKDLTDAEEATVDVMLGGQRVQASVDRSTFEQLVGDLVQKTLVSCQRALDDAELDPEDIQGVVLVGGSTRVPMVRRVVGDFFGQTPHSDLDPDKVVALGAAVQADLLSGQSSVSEDMLLLDVVPLSLGLETMGGVVTKLIHRCSPIPVEASETFTTHVDGQNAVDIHVLQGERERVADNRSLARFKVQIPPMPAGLPRVKVTFTVDADGIMAVSAREELTGAEAEVDVVPSYGIGDDEIERMLEEAIDHAETDMDERLLIDARVEAESVLGALDKALRADTSLLVGTEEVAITNARDALAAAMTSDDRKRISDLTHRLDEVSAPFAQRRIERDLHLALRGKATGDVAEEYDFADKI